MPEQEKVAEQDADPEELDADGFWYKQEKIALYICTECGALLPENAESCAVCGSAFEQEEADAASEVKVDLSEYECYRDFLDDDDTCKECQIRVQCKEASEEMDAIADSMGNEEWKKVATHRCIGSYNKRDKGCRECDPVIRQFCIHLFQKLKTDKELIKKEPDIADIKYASRYVIRKWARKAEVEFDKDDIEVSRKALLDALHPEWMELEKAQDRAIENGITLFKNDSDLELHKCFSKLMDFVSRDQGPPGKRVSSRGVRSFRQIGYKHLADCMRYTALASGPYLKERALEDAIITQIISQLHGLEKGEYQSLARKARDVFGEDSVVAARLERLTS